MTWCLGGGWNFISVAHSFTHGARARHINPITSAWVDASSTGSNIRYLADVNAEDAQLGKGFKGVLYYYGLFTRDIYIKGEHYTNCTDCDIYKICSHLTLDFCFGDVQDKFGSYILSGIGETTGTISNQVSSLFPITIGDTTSNDEHDPVL